MEGGVWNKYTTGSLCEIKTYDMPQHPTHMLWHAHRNTSHQHTQMNSVAHANTLTSRCVHYIKLLNDRSIFLHPSLNVKFVFECLCVSKWAIHLIVKSSIYPKTMWYWNHAVLSRTSNGLLKWVSETAISQCSLDKKEGNPVFFLIQNDYTQQY